MAKNIFYGNFFNFFKTGYPLLFIESKKTTEVVLKYPYFLPLLDTVHIPQCQSY